jgi:hypothetical protein
MVAAVIGSRGADAGRMLRGIGALAATTFERSTGEADAGA